MKTFNLKQLQFEVDPKDIQKCKRMTMNPMVGYRSVLNSNDRYLSEGTSIWYDRQLLDSIVTKPIIKNKEDSQTNPIKESKILDTDQEQKKKDFKKFWDKKY